MLSLKSYCVLLLLLLPAITIAQKQNQPFLVTRQQLPFSHRELGDIEFVKNAELSDIEHLQEASKRIAIPRIVGTHGHKQVREYIVQSLQDLNWSVEVQRFRANTPIFGTMHFSNIIAKLDPSAERFLMLSCHYDSKYYKDFDFIGATDSAVPCAMLLNLAHVLQAELKKTQNKKQKTSLMLVFFDGEEAFKEWNAQDSIYGARYMAQTWRETGFIDKIDVMLLLDLIGMSNVQFYNFFAKTNSWYSRLVDLEHRLTRTGLLQRHASSGITQHYSTNQYFLPHSQRNAGIEDDHIPFLKLGVPIVHLIPLPFPDVWHTANDNLSVIDFETTENVARVIRLFAIEYLKSDV